MERLTWAEIEIRYAQQWIELVDYEWAEDQSNPKSGVVIAHSADRSEFEKQSIQNVTTDSAILFVGNKGEMPSSDILNGFRQIKTYEPEQIL